MLWIARASAPCERARIKLGIAMAAMMAITVIRTKQTRAAIATTTTGGMPARDGPGVGAPRRAPQFWQKPVPSRASFPHDEQNMGSVMRATVGVVAFVRTARIWCVRVNKIAMLGGGKVSLEPRQHVGKSRPIL